jgi:hypothetical protein
MTDRFDAQLRQHLLGTAEERPAEGQLTSIVAQVGVTKQRRPLVGRLPGFPVRIGPFPAAVRLGLIAVSLVLAAMAGAILATGGAPVSTPFEGTWTTIDQPDGSTMNLYVGGGPSPTVRFEDLHATGAVCINDEVKVFTADGVGEISGRRLEATFPNGGGCGLETVSIAGVYLYNPDADTLRDQDGLIWTRIHGRDGPPPTLPPGPSLSPAVFEGRWTATDPGDESTLTLVVGEGTEPVVQFQDDLATGGACAADEVKVFRADGVGDIDGSRLAVIYPNGGGCGTLLVPIGGVYDYDADTDTLRDQDGVTWTRVAEGLNPAPTLGPAPTPRPGPTHPSTCIDLAQGGTYTARAGPMSLTATIPGTPQIPWQGSPDGFYLSSHCTDIAAITFYASSASDVYSTSCMPESLEITSFADAVARLDIPKGNDISDRIDLTIDGHPAARYDISTLYTCQGGFGLWHGTSLGAGETGSIYVIDVDGVLLAIELNRDGFQTEAELEEAYAIVASLQISR